MSSFRRQRPFACAPVVIAEDDPDSLALLVLAFGTRGIPVTSFQDGNLAWQHISSSADVRLVIATWMLPGLDGHLICRRLVQDRPDVLTVLMIGWAVLPEVQSPMHLVADYVLTKPLTHQGIHQQISMLSAVLLGELEPESIPNRLMRRDAQVVPLQTTQDA